MVVTGKIIRTERLFITGEMKTLALKLAFVFVPNVSGREEKSPVHEDTKIVNEPQQVGGHSKRQRYVEGSIQTRHPVGRLSGDTVTITPGKKLPKSVFYASDQVLRFHASTGA